MKIIKKKRSNVDSYITLTCPNCGGKLRITTEIDRFACAYCGHEHIVRRGVGTISLQPVVDGLHEVKNGVDKTSSELAIKRLNEEIESLHHQKETTKGRWYGSNYGWGALLIFMFAMITFSCFPSGEGSSTTSVLKLGATIIVAVIVLIYISKKKPEEEKEWAKFDSLISEKMRELRHHQRIVSKT
jgi:predicted RNA-binding Zn-ribbon protein involved in translation (DUF1610 family)